MVLPLGAIINSIAIIVGTLVGVMLSSRLKDDVRNIMFQALGFCAIVMGMQMALVTENILIIIFTMVLGGIIGESLKLEDKTNLLAEKIKKRCGSLNPTFTEGFVTATTLFCVGSLVILGPMEEGLIGDRTILMTKSVLDFFASIALASVLGIGVIFSALPVLIIEVAVTFLAVPLQFLISDASILEFKATGGVILIAIAFNVLDIKKIKVFNLMPAVFCILLIMYVKLMLFPV